MHLNHYGRCEVTMKKKLKEYLEKYGNVPNDFTSRFENLLSDLKIKDKDLKVLRKRMKSLNLVNWTKYSFSIYNLPQSTPRPRSGKRGIFYVKGARENSDFFKDFIESSGNDYGIITTPTIILIDTYHPIPNDMNRVEKILSELKFIRPIIKPDWDNLGKTYSDMIQKHLLVDDSIIIDGRVRKFYSFKPRVEICISFMDRYDSKYNKRKIESWNTYKELEDKILRRDFCE